MMECYKTQKYIYIDSKLLYLLGAIGGEICDPYTPQIIQFIILMWKRLYHDQFEITLYVSF